MVAGSFQHSNLVLDLDHQDGISVFVDLGQMLHQSCESPQVGLQHVVGEAASYLHGLALSRHGPWKAPCVLLEPQRGIARHGVFPDAEPQQHHMETVFTGSLQGVVDEGEIETPLNGLQQLPVYRHEHGVQSQGCHTGHHDIDVGTRRGS